jgi:hypothetical protein
LTHAQGLGSGFAAKVKNGGWLLAFGGWLFWVVGVLSLAFRKGRGVNGQQCE